MYLFSRRARLSGAKLGEATAWAAEMAQRSTQTTGLQIGLWSQVYSPEVGTLVWATFVPDLATLEAATDKLLVDDAYNAGVERGQQYLVPGTTDDSLGVVIHGDPDPDRQVEYVAVVRSTIANGQLKRGMALGVEIAQRAEALTGIPTAFVTDATGNFGGVAWLSAYPNIAELERAEMTINTDEGFIELIDTKGAGAYTDAAGGTTQLIYRRIPV